MIPPPPYQCDAKAYVYLIRSLSVDKFYIGWTTDINRRIDEHNLGKSFYTRSRGPWELIGFEKFSSSEEAKKREKALKHNSRMNFLFKKRLLAAKEVVG